MSRKKYVVELSSDEREHLKSVISKGKAAAKTILKARILLKSDQGPLGEGWTDDGICQALDTNESMTTRVRRRLVEEGLTAVLSRKKRGVHGQIKKRTEATIRHRGGDRSLQNRRPSGPKLPARPPRRPDQRRHERRRLQPAPHPQVVEETIAQNHRRNMGRDNPVPIAQTGFLTTNFSY